MSRRSDVRDAVIEAVQSAIPSRSVESVVVPQYSREELESGPRICVRYGSRDTNVDQGPDETNISIEIGVIGITPKRESSSDQQYREQTVVACDEYDELMEQIIALWTPNGPLAYTGMADHAFRGLKQAIDFDPQKLYAEGIWLSMIRLTYQDSVDDED